VSCHAAEGKQMKEFPSAHSQQECTLCHPDRHRAILKCLECHGVHVEGQTYEECLSCHKPHMPKNIHYSEPANKVCAACHAEVAANLDSTPTKHHTLKCAFCHRDKHGMVPTCETCHGQPHPAAMHQKFPSCNQCHQDAHALVK
jgi:predicted CXXCH cytochrome family protein